jgi:hypothetical protein
LRVLLVLLSHCCWLLPLWLLAVLLVVGVGVAMAPGRF